MNIKLYGESILFDNQKCLMKFQNFNSCFEKTTNCDSQNPTNIYLLTHNENQAIEKRLSISKSCYTLKNVLLAKAKEYSADYTYMKACIKFDLLYRKNSYAGEEIFCKCNLNRENAFITVYIKTT